MSCSTKIPPCPVRGYDWVWPRKRLKRTDRYLWALVSPGSRRTSSIDQADLHWYGPKGKVVVPAPVTFRLGKTGGYIRKITRRA